MSTSPRLLFGIWDPVIDNILVEREKYHSSWNLYYFQLIAKPIQRHSSHDALFKYILHGKRKWQKYIQTKYTGTMQMLHSKCNKTEFYSTKMK